MAWAGSVGACHSRKTRPGGSALQPGRRPDFPGSRSAALDVGRCGLLQDPDVKARSRERPVLRELKELLQSVRPRTQVHDTPGTEHRYLLDAGGADGGIGGPAEIEPTPVVCSSATQPALDRSVVRCPTNNSAITGAVTKAESRKSGRGENRRGGAR